MNTLHGALDSLIRDCALTQSVVAVLPKGRGAITRQYARCEHTTVPGTGRASHHSEGSAQHPTGTVTGTAAPCIGPPPSENQKWMVHVTLRRGTKVVGRRTVTDSFSAGEKLTLGRFAFTEPEGTYVVVGVDNATQTVIVKPGKIVRVALPNNCE